MVSRKRVQANAALFNHTADSSAEKSELLLGNAQLSQDLETLKRRSSEQVRDLREEVQQKNNSIAGLEQVLQEMSAEISVAKDQVRHKLLLEWVHVRLQVVS